MGNCEEKYKDIKFFQPQKKISYLIPLTTESIQAGFPSFVEGGIEHSLDLNEYLIHHPAATFFAKVTGDSMKDAHIFKGDILIIDRSLQAKHNSIVVAILNGEFTVKRLQIENERLLLFAENPKFPPIPITEESDFQVWGVVTYIIHKTCTHS